MYCRVHITRITSPSSTYSLFHSAALGRWRTSQRQRLCRNCKQKPFQMRFPYCNHHHHTWHSSCRVNESWPEKGSPLYRLLYFILWNRRTRYGAVHLGMRQRSPPLNSRPRLRLRLTRSMDHYIGHRGRERNWTGTGIIRQRRARFPQQKEIHHHRRWNLSLHHRVYHKILFIVSYVDGGCWDQLITIINCEQEEIASRTSAYYLLNTAARMWILVPF